MTASHTHRLYPLTYPGQYDATPEVISSAEHEHCALYQRFISDFDWLKDL